MPDRWRGRAGRWGARRTLRPQLKRDSLGGTEDNSRVLATISEQPFDLATSCVMTPQSPTATTQALFEALRNRDWAGAVALADPDALAAWHRSERASLANLLLAPGPPDLEADDMAAVEELLREHANAKVRLANIGTLQALTSLSPAAYLVRLWEILDQLFGSRPEDERTPSFQIVGEDRHSDDRVYVRYRGYLGVGGGMPETLEFRRRGDSWRWVITPELATPNFAVLIGAQGGPR